MTWRRSGGTWTAVSPGDLKTRLDAEGLSSPRGLLTLRDDRGFTMLVDKQGSTRLRVRRGTNNRGVVTTATGRYRVTKQLMRPIWDVTPEVAGELIVQVLAIGPLLRIRPASGAADLPDRELADLHRGVVVAILSCRGELPSASMRPAAA